MKPEERAGANVRELRDPDSLAQAATLAAAVAAELAAALTRRPQASLVVSGGRTPAAMLRQLATHKIEWSRISVTLADERWVAVDDPASNERMVRLNLLQGRAAKARFVGLKNEATTPAAGASQAWSAINALPRPFDVMLLGMGDDGHTASLFPGSAELPLGLDMQVAPGCLAVHPSGVAPARLTLNLAALLQARHIHVQLSGARKWLVYQQALGEGPVESMPIRAILRQSAVPVDVYWSPEQPEAAAF